MLTSVIAVALFAPYRRLTSPHATARESILFSPPLHPLVGIHTSVSARHYFLALVAVIGLLSEVLCITLSAIPFNPATLLSAYYVSTWISVAVLSLMLLALVFVFFYKEPDLPVRPDTVVSNLVYLCDSSLPEMFRDLGGQNTQERNNRISDMGMTYYMGISPTSGVQRLAVLATRGSNAT